MIQSFNQVRLSNQFMSASGGRLLVSNSGVVYQSETGQFITASQTGAFGGSANTGALTGVFYPLTGNPSGFILPAQTGAFSSNSNVAATGAIFATYTGNIQDFVTGISPTGLDNYFIQFPFNFSSTPRVLTTVEVTGNIVYGTAISNRTVSGFTALFSDYIAESGVKLNVYATIN